MLEDAMIQTEHTLPEDVLYLVLEEVITARDFSTLKAMSLASQAFLPLCRSHLFRDVTIPFASDRHYAQCENSSDDFAQFSSFLISSPHITQSIRRLVLSDVSGISNWSPLEEEPLGNAPSNWSTISAPLTRILREIEHLQTLEIRSELELDWTSFDAEVKQAIYDILQQPSCASTRLRLSSIRNICDPDLVDFLSACTNITFAQARFSLKSFTSSASGALKISLNTVKLGRHMGVEALDWLQHYPASLAGVRRLIIESLSAAVPVSDFWAFAQGTRDSLSHLEWWFEDLAYREPRDAIALKQIDLSIFPELRSISIHSSQSGQLINLMVILESTGLGNQIESINIIMPSSIDKFIVFRPSTVWNRLNAVLGGPKFQRHLREVTLSFAWTNQPIPPKSVNALFCAFKKNLPSLRGKDLAVNQKKARPL
ncbi:hypothetical protein BDZ97DRAFT_810625 [Flammula alnicola]|nr:hypothetical protein BDZ97DRAFT_810625 [Flammula alnicola]